MAETSNPVLSQNGTLPVHHKNYYLEDGVIFLVENTLFKVPRYLLVRESPVFEDMFSMPSSAQPEGHSDETPIQLLQVTAVDFERILAVIYPLRFNIELHQRLQTPMRERNFFPFPPPSSSDAEDEEHGEEERKEEKEEEKEEEEETEEAKWTSVLHLATRWQMSEVRELSIRSLESLADSVSLVTLGRLYDYPQWILNGLSSLCMRNEPLGIPEAARLSKEEVLKIAEARETFKSYKDPRFANQCTGWSIRCCEDKTSQWPWPYKYGDDGWGLTWPGEPSEQACKHVKAHLILDRLFGLSNIPGLKELISDERDYVDRLAKRQKSIESAKEVVENRWWTPPPPEVQPKRFAKLRESFIFKRFAKLTKSRDTSVDMAEVIWASDSSVDPDSSD